MVVKLTPKLWQREGNYLIWCPACKCGHVFPTPRWGYSGNAQSPTFTPSMRLYYTDPETKQDITICHFNVTNGQLVYHGDCPHEMKGQTLDMHVIPTNYEF